MWCDHVGEVTKDAKFNEGQNVWMLQGGNLAGLMLKVFQVCFVLLWSQVHWPVQKAHKIRAWCVGVCEKGGAYLALPNKPFQVVIPQDRSGQLVIWHVFNQRPIPHPSILTTIYILIRIHAALVTGRFLLIMRYEHI